MATEAGSILVVNAGSTSLKLNLIAEDGTATRVDSLEDVDPAGVAAVAHRVVHGGSRFREPAVIDEAVRDEIFALQTLAPLHNAPALAGIATAERALPEAVHVAVFDTAFHATIPEEAAVYAVPPRWLEEWGVRRYGFHGLSVAWSAERAPPVLGGLAARRVPPGRRLLDHRRPRRPLRRHDDGVLAAGGRADDHALRLDRSGRARLPAGHAQAQPRDARTRSQLRVRPEGTRWWLGIHARARATGRERRRESRACARRVHASRGRSRRCDGRVRGGARRARLHRRHRRRLGAGSRTRQHALDVPRRRARARTQPRRGARLRRRRRGLDRARARCPCPRRGRRRPSGPSASRRLAKCSRSLIRARLVEGTAGSASKRAPWRRVRSRSS